MLRLQNIDVFYGKVQALNDVCITVEQGQIVALVGSNGAGKSTTLKTISGLLKPSKGTIEYKDNSIGGLARMSLLRWELDTALKSAMFGLI